VTVIVVNFPAFGGSLFSVNHFIGATFSLLLLMLPSIALAGESQSGKLATQQEQESYSIGYQVGLSMKSDGVEANFEALTKGLQDAIDGRDPQLSMEEMKRLIVDVKKRAREAGLRKVQETIVKNAEESDKFLAENGQKPGVKTTASGLQYVVLKEGDGPIPKADDMVRVHYRGSFINGKEFDSSYAMGEPQTFRADGVIKGWAEALQMMKVGSKWQLFVPPDLAYGRGGLGQKIPPNSVLVFDVELLAIESTKGESKS